MKHLKLFEEYHNELNERILVYPPNNPYKPKGSMEWTGFVKNTENYIKSGEHFSLVCDVDYDMYTADPRFRSKAQGTWKDKSLPLFTSKYPRYREVEFDLVAVEPNEESPNAPWLRIVDKKGTEFMIHPFHVLEIQMGSSVRDRISAGSTYLIDKMRGTIVDYRKNNVTVKLQDGSTKVIPIDQWKKAGYMELDENKDEESGEAL